MKSWLKGFGIKKGYAKSLWKNVLAVAVVLLTFYFLGHQFFSNMDELKGFDWQIDYVFLVLAIIVTIFFYLIAHLRWKLILNFLRCPISAYRSLKYWMFAELGRYIPGKLWFVLGRAYFGKKEGIRRSVIFLSTFLELLILAGTSVIIFLLGVAFVTDLESWVLLLSLLAIILLLVAIYPPIFNWMFNLILRILKREPHKISIPYTKMLGLVLVFILMWVIHGSAFYLTSKAVYPALELSLQSFGLFVGVFAASWLIGFVSFLTPGGIGVREAVMTYYLSFYLPAAMAVIMAIAFRLLLILAEFGFGAVLLILHKLEKNKY